PLDAAARVADGKRDPGAEAVVVSALAPLLNQAGRLELGDREARPLPPGQNLVPGARGEADPERLHHLVAEAAAREVGARLLRLRRGAKEGAVELGGAGEDVAEPGSAPPSLLGAGVGALALDLDAVPVGEGLDRLREG